VEGSFRKGPNRGTRRAAQGEPGPEGDTGGAGAAVEKDSAKAWGWQHALVVPEDGRSNWSEPGHRVQDLVENALDRLDPILPLSPGRAEKHGFEYYRHGTLSLYAALDVTTGQVHGKTASRHTSADFIDFLTEIVERNPQPREIHIVLDNLSAHKTQTVKDFLEQNPRVRFHFTPTYSSWLNQVEIWFAKIERDVIARGVFTSVADLSRKLMKYIRLYAKSARPFRWKYTDLRRRIVTK